VQKQVHTWNAGTSAYQLSTTLRFLYDGWNLITELNASNQVVRSYAWGLDLSGSLQGAGGVGGLLVITDAPSSTSYLPACDSNGNILTLVNAIDGSIAAQYDYGPFGEPLRATGAMARANPFRFSTKYQDDETGLLYYGHRYYQSYVGRWMSQDPLEEMDSANLFAIATNDTVAGVDAFGLAEINVRLQRESYGYFNTYGSVMVTSDDKRVSECCGLPKTWNTVELPWGNYALRLGDWTRPAAPRPMRDTSLQRDAGLAQLDTNKQNPRSTTPKALADAFRVKLPKVPGIHPDDYNTAIISAFNTGNGAIDIHAGTTSCNSLFCPIIGNEFSPQFLPPADRRHPFPNVPVEPPGQRYRSSGFDINESLEAQIRFNAAIACAERILGRRPTIEFKLATPGQPKWSGGSPPVAVPLR
jgi:RHS repeat-associated protein